LPRAPAPIERPAHTLHDALPISELSDQFGVIETDPADRTTITAFVEKPKQTEGLVDDPGSILASMGNYIFSADALVEAVTQDAEDDTSKHDMGGDIVPSFVADGDAAVY